MNVDYAQLDVLHTWMINLALRAWGRCGRNHKPGIHVALWGKEVPKPHGP